MEQILLSPREIRRYEMVQARLKEGHKVEKILLDYGISRRTFYVNLHKFEGEGIKGLKSRWGEHRKTNEKTEEEFLELFKEHPYFSSYEFSEIISLNPRTIQRIIARKKLMGVYKPKKERKNILRNIKKTKKRNIENKEKNLQKERNKKQKT